MRIKRKKVVLALTLLLVIMSTSTSLAYAKLKPVMAYPSPRQIKVSLPRAFSAYKNDIMSWQNKSGGRVRFQFSAYGKNLIISDCTGIDNNTYAVTFRGSNSKKTIAVYRDFKYASSVRRHETMVHEVGHALGLAHISSAQKPSTSVMRRSGFNWKAYPLNDDIRGIKSIY